ncbi:MAG: ABC transporter permease [Alphaproteobacteria bacterium]|nr:ABC transporter permease [Alphaproteobacteria bacterium]
MPPERHIGAVNWVGLGTLYGKECRRFFKVWLQTIVAPIITSMLFLAVFALAIGRSMPELGGVSFLQFMAPGLIVMAIMQNSFANTSSSLMISKVQGNVVDVLMPPLSPGELLIGFAFGGVSRGLTVALMLSLVILPFVHLEVHNFGFLLLHALAASLMLSLLGLLTAIWAEKFDQLAAVTNFVVTPLAFLSGTFYSIDRLPEPLFTASKFNPFFYLIDGFRYGMICHADGSLAVGAAVVLGCVAVMWLICHRILTKGYRLKS